MSERRVPGYEPRPRPRGDLVGLERAQTVLVVADEPVLTRPESEREREPRRVRALQRLLCEEHVPFRLEPLERKRVEPRGRLHEKGEDEIGVAARPEAREDVVDAAVPVERAPARHRQRQVLDEMGDPAGRRFLVGAPDPDDQRSDEGRRPLREEDGDASDRRSFELAQPSTRSPTEKKTIAIAR